MSPNKSVEASWQRIVILCSTETTFAASVSRGLRRRGWQVYAAAKGCEARRLVHKLGPVAVLLDVSLPDESGWLICEKLRWDQADCRIVLISDSWSQEERDMADFVGADALVFRTEGPEAVINEVACVSLPAAV